MILAAGRGERLRPLTDAVPKALIEVKGECLLERHLRSLKKAGAETIVINLGWLGEAIVDRIGSGSRFGLHVVYSPEDDNVLDTGGGIRRALPLLGAEPFWVINADVYTDFQPGGIELGEHTLGHLVLVPTPRAKARGDFDLEDGLVRNAENPKLTFSGMALYRPELLEDQPAGRFPLVPILREAADKDRLTGNLFEGLWADTGTPAQLERLNRG